MAGQEPGSDGTARDPAIRAFLSSVGAALACRTLGFAGSAAVGRIFGALASTGSPGTGQGRRLPVCEDHLPRAVAAARRHGPELARLADTFAAMEPRLRWAPRAAGGPHASEDWPDGHANAMIVGPGGLEDRSDLQVGVSVMAPRVRYPDHDHGPEEVYLVLSPGRFRHGDSGWFEPGIGGTLYNAPAMRHAMAADDAPLFAVWLLWVGGSAAR